MNPAFCCVILFNFMSTEIFGIYIKEQIIIARVIHIHLLHSQCIIILLIIPLQGVYTSHY